MKKNKQFLIFLLILLSSGLMFTGQLSSAAQTVPPVMYGFLAHILDLQPYLYSKEAFVSDQNQKLVGEQLKEFSALSEQLKKHDRLQTPGFKVPASMIINQLRDVNDAYQNGHREYAWRSLRSTLNNCSQCHTQVSKSSRAQAPVWAFETQNLPKDPMELGDFWFMIRSYDKAFDQFSTVVQNYGKSMKDQFMLRKALRHILIIMLRIEQSPDKALKYLNQLNTNSFPTYLKNEIVTWKNELTVLKMLPPMDIKTVSVNTFENAAEDIFRSAYPIARENRSKEIAMEYGSGLLFEFVNLRPKEVTQRMYFWLGISNVELDRYEFTAFGDPYLKECIENFPPSPISHECYTALEDNWVFGYSGSAGTFLPKSYQDELKRLQQLLKK